MIDAGPMQAAIFAALTTPPMSAGVYEEVPQGVVLTKYVVIGAIPFERPWDTHDSEGSEQFHQIDAWHKAETGKEVRQLMEEIDTRLHNTKLTLSTGQNVSLVRDFAQVLREQPAPGEKWRHGVMRYRAWIAE